MGNEMGVESNYLDLSQAEREIAKEALQIVSPIITF